MADNTPRMIALLGKMRKQMNGAVADAMRYYGADYGLNYGVSLPTVREIAKAEGVDHELALYLYRQQVRELRLAALYIADAHKITMDSLSEWEQGVVNSEVAEEMAFALLRYADSLPDIYAKWIKSDNEFLTYSALMAIARTAFGCRVSVVEDMAAVVERHHSSRIIAQGVVAVLAAAYECDAECRKAVEVLIAEIGESLAAEYVREEMTWRMECYG